MPLLFISHASSDKKKIRPIVTRLIADGFKLWLDNPRHKDLDFSPDYINTHFFYINPDDEWRDQIGEGLMQADAVVACWSSRALQETKRNFEWFVEIRQAKTMGKLVSCRIDDFDPSKLGHNFGSLQMTDLSPGDNFEKELGLFVGDVRKKLAERRRQALDARKKSKAAGSELSPYLINREKQEGLFTRSAVEVEVDGGVKPLFLMSPDNEGLERFIQRVEEHAIPRRLPSRQSWKKLIVKWPDVEPDRFAAEYRHHLVDALSAWEVLPRASDEEIKAAINNFGTPVAFHSLMLATDWTHQEPQRIKAWLGFWEALAAKPPKLSVIPLITLKMPPVKPGWTRVPAGSADGARVTYAEIWNAIEKLAGVEKSSWFTSLFWPEEKTIPIGAPPILHPIRNTDAEAWLIERDFKLETAPYAKAKGIIDGLFAGRQAKEFGISLEDFAKAVRPLFHTRG